MKVSRTDIEGLMIVELLVRRDERGFFIERFQERWFREHALPVEFVQDNHSRSEPGVLRGLHYQFEPPQGKLIGVTRGRIWDVAVDLRPDSTTYGRAAGLELNDSTPRLLWIPTGFAHGFCVLGDEPADVVYKVDSYYSAGGEGGIHWADPDLGIGWPIKNPLVSPRDQSLPSFARYRKTPPVWGRT
jgi:dTDP-4-dehydrorhamnose 3,5-epimerase